MEKLSFLNSIKKESLFFVVLVSCQIKKELQKCQGKNLSELILPGNKDALNCLPIWLHIGDGFRGLIMCEYA
jgi:hypothetical protein